MRIAIWSLCQKGLFHRAIAQSGSTNGAFTTHNLHPKCALEKIATNVHCDISKPDLLTCLQKATAENIGKCLRYLECV